MVSGHGNGAAGGNWGTIKDGSQVAVTGLRRIVVGDRIIFGMGIGPGRRCSAYTFTQGNS